VNARPAVKVRLCSVDEVISGEAQRFDVDGYRICLVRIGDDFYALGDRCSHQDFSLSEGEVYPEDLEIECWKHGSTFSLTDGEPQSLPATKPVPVYDVSVEDNSVMVVVR
jgi:3-phenylpropionate/trans-cinnamate dioxygenase ferredoxin subunit